MQERGVIVLHSEQLTQPEEDRSHEDARLHEDGGDVQQVEELGVHSEGSQRRT